jgi:hypothetical protein
MTQKQCMNATRVWTSKMQVPAPVMDVCDALFSGWAENGILQRLTGLSIEDEPAEGNLGTGGTDR